MPFVHLVGYGRLWHINLTQARGHVRLHDRPGHLRGRKRLLDRRHSALGGEYRPVPWIMFLSTQMPMETHAADPRDTDTLVIGEGQQAATLTEENGDITAYWGPDDGAPEVDISLLAVALRNTPQPLARFTKQGRHHG